MLAYLLKPRVCVSLMKTLEPASLPRGVSTAGRGSFYFLTYSFNLLIQAALTFPLLWGVLTMDVHQTVGWLALDVTPDISNLSNFMGSSK